MPGPAVGAPGEAVVVAVNVGMTLGEVPVGVAVGSAVATPGSVGVAVAVVVEEGVALKVGVADSKGRFVRGLCMRGCYETA